MGESKPTMRKRNTVGSKKNLDPELSKQRKNSMIIG